MGSQRLKAIIQEQKSKIEDYRSFLESLYYPGVNGVDFSAAKKRFEQIFPVPINPKEEEKQSD